MPAPKFNPNPPIAQGRIATLKKALEVMLPIPLGLEDTPPVSSYGEWKSPMQLSKEVLELTDQNDVKNAYYVLTQWQETFTEAPQYEAPTTSNIPQTGLRETQAEKLEQFEKAYAEAKEEGIKQTQEFIESQLKRVKNIKITLKEEAPIVTLDKQVKEKLHDYGVAAKTDPGTTQKIVEEKIQESLSKSTPEIQGAIPPQVITKTAVDFVNKVTLFGDYKTAEEIPDKISVMHPASPIAAIALVNDAKLKGLITDDQARKILSQNAQSVALAIETERNVNATLTRSFLYENPNITTVLYGPEQITQFEISDDQSDKNEDGIDIDVGEIIDRGKDIRDIWEKIATGRTTTAESGEIATTISSYTPSVNTAVISQSSSLLTKVLPVTGAVVGFQGSILASQWIANGTPLLLNPQVAGLIGSGGFQTTALASLATQGQVLYFAGIGKYSFTIAKLTKGPVDLYAAGLNFGNKGFGLGAIKIGGKVVSTGTITSAGGKIAGKALPAIFTRIGAFLGSVGPVIGTLIGATLGWIAGKILEKIPWDKVKKALPYVVGALLFPFFGPVAAIAGGLGTALLGGATIAGIGTGIGAFFWTLGRATAITIGTPIIVTLLVFPVVVALILFIINSSAYIVPPAPLFEGSGTITSPYIDVIKTPNPPGPFQNSDLPLTVEYTVTIKAKKGTLTNVQITYSCSVVKKSSSTICPNPEPPVPTTVENGISPASPFTFTYKQTYNELNYQDSFVTDTITVTADTPEQSGVQAAGSATIKIGNPPEDCPAIWPTSHGYITQGAYTPSSCGNNCSHGVLEAIDIGVSLVEVVAGHSGTIVTSQQDSCLGNYIQIQSNCGGKDYISRYAHLEGTGVKNGQTVTMGQKIGLSGNTGSCTTGAHLHYEFRYWPDGKPSWPNNPPFMMSPYIPQDVPRGCRNTAECSVSY